MSRLLLSCLLFCLSYTPLSAQYFLNGSAVQTNDSCFQLTSETLFDVGSIWFPEKIDLRNNFDLVMDMNFGCLDGNGADGIVFGLQPVSASIGEAGEGLGIGGIRPAVGVEFDTFQNGNRNDPSFDHVAIMANGAVTHAGPDNLAGPTQADPINGNIETCQFLPLRVTWDAPNQTMRVYFNCDLRLEYTGDIINDIFGGDPFVFYGFASATGGLVNRHEVCFRFNSFLKALEDVTMCPGAQVLLDVAGGARTVWSPAAGLDDPTASNVVASPDTTTTYTVQIFDNCDIPIRDTVTITVAGDSAFVDLGPDTTICPQNPLTFDVTTPTAIYEWSDPDLMGPVVNIFQAGTYDVTVTRQDIICEASDRIMIENHPIPELDLGPPDTALCAGELLKIFPSNDIGQPILDLDGGIPFDTLYLSRPGRYRAFIDDPCGVIFDQIDLSFVNCEKVYLPNAFSPNGDGINDFFFPQDGGDVETVHLLMIYDRWGEEVYRAAELPTNQAGLGWDGRLNGRPVNPGTFVWYLEATFRNGVRGSRRGSVTVVR